MVWFARSLLPRVQSVAKEEGLVREALKDYALERLNTLSRVKHYSDQIIVRSLALRLVKRVASAVKFV